MRNLVLCPQCNGRGWVPVRLYGVNKWDECRDCAVRGFFMVDQKKTYDQPQCNSPPSD